MSNIIKLSKQSMELLDRFSKFVLWFLMFSFKQNVLVKTNIDFAAIPHTEHACSDSGEEKSTLTARNLQQNQAHCERPSATTDWVFERTEQKLVVVRSSLLKH
ncbi:hypothetical protein CHARACLAT_003382 [Characodon lateralis]|uniref:Uncharacterized protein n=1 Tax=Characodon lateralis TaxID=208331 RepID=A0ABU7DFT8_9TELE|nr:hypothetical protein [Characodon lateralis]